MGFLTDHLTTKPKLQALQVTTKNKKVEEQKIKNEEQKTKWSAKEAELLYKTKLMKTKVELEADGFSKETILSMFPDLSPIYDNTSSS